MIRTKRIERLHHRGSRSRRGVALRHPRKAALEYRGKGAKVERRSRRSQARRKAS